MERLEIPVHLNVLQVQMQRVVQELQVNRLDVHLLVRDNFVVVLNLHLRPISMSLKNLRVSIFTLIVVISDAPDNCCLGYTALHLVDLITLEIHPIHEVAADRPWGRWEEILGFVGDVAQVEVVITNLSVG